MALVGANFLGEVPGIAVPKRFDSASSLWPTIPPANRRQYAVGDPPRTLRDASHLALSIARVHLDDLRTYADRHAITGETPKNTIQRYRQDDGAYLGHLLTLPNCIADARLCAKDALDRCVDVAITKYALPLFVEETGWDPGEIVNRLDQASLEHEVTVQSEFYPDVFDPFIYEPGEYDQIVAILLSVLLEGWTELRTHEQALPIWWSPQIEVALRAIAERSETKTEARVRLNREQRKLNRLGVKLTRTPQELSREILVRLSQEQDRPGQQ